MNQTPDRCPWIHPVYLGVPNISIFSIYHGVKKEEAGVHECFSCVRLVATSWTVACQAPLSMEFSRQGYWSGLPGPPPGDLPDPGTKPESLMSSVLAGGFFTTSTIWEAHEEAHIRIYDYTDFFQVYIGSSKSVYLIEQKRKKTKNVRTENNRKWRYSVGECERQPGPQRCPCPKPWDMLPCSAGTLKILLRVTDLEIGRLSWTVWVGPI